MPKNLGKNTDEQRRVHEALLKELLLEYKTSTDPNSLLFQKAAILHYRRLLASYPLRN